MTKLAIIGAAMAKQLGIDDLFTLINEHTGHFTLAVYVVIAGIACIEHKNLDELCQLIGLEKKS